MMPNDFDKNRKQTRPNRLIRRQFVAAVVAAPTIVPSSVLGANAPSNRINVALMGCGNQSRVDLPSMLRQPKCCAGRTVSRGRYQGRTTRQTSFRLPSSCHIIRAASGRNNLARKLIGKK